MSKNKEQENQQRRERERIGAGAGKNFEINYTIIMDSEMGFPYLMDSYKDMSLNMLIALKNKCDEEGMAYSAPLANALREKKLI